MRGFAPSRPWSLVLGGAAALLLAGVARIDSGLEPSRPLAARAEPLPAGGAQEGPPPAGVERGAAAAIPASGLVTRADRAVAFGHLLDSPRPIDVIDEGIVIAEELRRRYGIDTGDVLSDRRQAAERARAEILDGMQVTPRQIEAMARILGYSLDPADCVDYCDNVRRLALLEIQKRALRAFAHAGERPAAATRTDGTAAGGME